MNCGACVLFEMICTLTILHLYRAWIEVVVQDPLLDDWVVDDVPDRVLKTPSSSPVTQKAAKKRAKVLGKSKEARGKEEEIDYTHPESSGGRVMGELVRKGASFCRRLSGVRLDGASHPFLPSLEDQPE